MRSTLTVIAAAVLLAAACGKGGGAEAPTEAGAVTALAGEVTAMRSSGDTARPLAVGDTVFSDDTITTAPDATVTVTLRHNEAQWTLAGDMSRRVDQSAAWRAPKGGGEATFVAGDPDRTASAGRHTEPEPEVAREAAAQDSKDLEQFAAPPAPAPTAAAEPPPPPPPSPDPEPQHDRLRKEKRRKSPPRDLKTKDALSDDALFDEEAPAEHTNLTREEIVAELVRVGPAVKKCAEAHDGAGQTVRIKLLIARDGSVSGALPMDDHAKTDLGRCVAGAVRAARFRENSGPPSVIFPFKL